MGREKFSSRFGFILISAGCAIGLGNVWRFPYITGQYGGAAFVLIYLLFLVIMGVPIMVMELAVGRASQKSAASFQSTKSLSSEKLLHCITPMRLISMQQKNTTILQIILCDTPFHFKRNMPVVIICRFPRGSLSGRLR